MNVTKADYDELVRLRDERYCTVVFRDPKAHTIEALGFMESGLASEGTLEFIQDGQAIYIAAAIAEYERAQEGK